MKVDWMRRTPVERPSRQLCLPNLPFLKCYFSISGGAANLQKCEEAGLCILRSLKHYSGFSVLLDLRNKTVRPNP